MAGVDLTKLSPKDLLKALDGLKPEQLVSVKTAAIAAGLAVAPPPTTGFIEHANGDIEVTVRLTAEVAQGFKAWAEAAGEPIGPFLQKMTSDALAAYAGMDWESMAAPPTAAAAAK